MFCSSLRKRKEWAPAVAQLTGSTNNLWKEAKLETHHVEFSTPSQRDGDQTFRIFLLTSAEVGTPQANEGLERLPFLDGTGKTAIVFLLGEDDMAAFMELQLMLLSRDEFIPIIPVSSAADLPRCIDALRYQCATPGAHEQVAKSTPRQLLSYCSRGGTPLSERQTKILSELGTGFGHLAQQAFDPVGREQLCEFLGPVDGEGVAAFFTAGPGTVPG